MSNIQDVVYTIVYENGAEVSGNCKVNMDTWQVFDVMSVEHDSELDEVEWVDQYVTLADGKEYDVHWVEYCGDGNYFWFV